ncbi:YbaK/EbsC family protein [Cryptosporangium sp. NPDC051539]|uniref:YbaK/EbsC family protein n=1 Tax=Cryptosporangium sp. NPDC051539 TaxID=3363962 RepID=UPI00379FD63F
MTSDVSPAAHPNVTAVNDVLTAFGSRNRVRILPGEARTAAAAAEALGVTVGQIANSLVFDADGVPLLVLASGEHRVDTTMIAALCEVATVRRATPDFVRDVTGQAIGGVAPVGHPNRLRTLVDVALARYETVWAAGGVPHAVFPTTYDELLRITGGVAAEVA